MATTYLSLKRKYDTVNIKFNSEKFFSEYKIENIKNVNNSSDAYIRNMFNYIKKSYQNHLENSLDNKDSIKSFVKYLKELKYKHKDSVYHFNQIKQIIKWCNLSGITDINIIFTNYKKNYIENQNNQFASKIKKNLLCFQLVLQKYLIVKNNPEEIINDFINHHNLISKVLFDLILECDK